MNIKSLILSVLVLCLPSFVHSSDAEAGGRLTAVCKDGELSLNQAETRAFCSLSSVESEDGRVDLPLVRKATVEKMVNERVVFEYETEDLEIGEFIETLDEIEPLKLKRPSDKDIVLSALYKRINKEESKGEFLREIGRHYGGILAKHFGYSYEDFLNLIDSCDVRFSGNKIVVLPNEEVFNRRFKIIYALGAFCLFFSGR